MISGANNIANHRQEVDALNVFPVPDGDTGTNMSMTMTPARRELGKMGDDVSVAQVSHAAASALLRGARGNSGVILSLLFRGFSKGLQNKESADANDLVHALTLGVEAAYKAVMKPTEGTILTVSRLAAEHGAQVLTERPDISAQEMWQELVAAAAQALEKTPDLLPVLKKAGVVDSGGKGLLFVFEGMKQVIDGGDVIPLEEGDQKSEAPKAVSAAGASQEEITFTYCTEFIVLKKKGCGDPVKLRAFLESIGDCVVVVEDENIIKVHVHTDNPGNALQAALKYGMLTNIKIDNMREEHERAAAKAASEEPAEPTQDAFPYRAVDPDQDYGFVAVAAGEGIKALFQDLGVENVVSGGQTMNPSTDEILKAVHATPAKTVFVLPNNKNIIMAAEQTIKLADRKVIVLPSRFIPQGLSAMLAFDPEADVKTNHLNMTKALEKVGTGQLTFAARDSEYDNQVIKKGELLAMENGKIVFTEKSMTKSVIRLTRSLVKKASGEEGCFVTLLYGEDVTEEKAQQVERDLKAKLPEDVEVTLVNGGQPVYYFIISVE